MEKGKTKAMKICIAVLVVVAALGAIAYVNRLALVAHFVNWESLYQMFGYLTEEESQVEREKLGDMSMGENREIGSEYDASLAMTCSNGVFVGTREGDVISWKGVPYATQPVNDMRWRAPQAAPDSDKVFEAKYFGHQATQGECIDEPASLYLQGEDCLNLNIWSNVATESELKPVMVFIPGGAYISGGTADSSYDCQMLAQDSGDAVYVTLNYRIGFLGFANFEKIRGGEEYAGSDNLGLLDQMEALRWVKKNAASFGGDGDNITVFGQSAGAGSAVALMASDMTEGLFQHVIAQSGNASSYLRTKESSQDYTKQLMAIAGVKDMDGLLALSTEQMKEAMTKTYVLTAEYTYPVCDGIVIPEDILGALRSGNGKDVDFITGTNKDEANYWMIEMSGEEAFVDTFGGAILEDEKRMNEKQREVLARVGEPIEGKLTVEEIETFYNYAKFHMPARLEARAHAQGGGNSYVYFFSEESEDPVLKSCHSFELRYVFDHVDEYLYSAEPADPYLMKTMQRAWINFAKTGNPDIPAGEVDGAGALTWVPYSQDSTEVMLFNSTGCGMVADPLQPMADEFSVFDGFAHGV